MKFCNDTQNQAHDHSMSNCENELNGRGRESKRERERETEADRLTARRLCPFSKAKSATPMIKRPESRPSGGVDSDRARSEPGNRSGDKVENKEEAEEGTNVNRVLSSPTQQPQTP